MHCLDILIDGPQVHKGRCQYMAWPAISRLLSDYKSKTCVRALRMLVLADQHVAYVVVVAQALPLVSSSSLPRPSAVPRTSVKPLCRGVLPGGLSGRNPTQPVSM
jgi:hypothetical protein